MFAGPALPPGVKFAQAVKLSGSSLERKRIVVVGGGMTAASLALGAAKHGASGVLMFSRSRLKVQDLSCDPGWAGNKHLNHFNGIESWQASQRRDSKPTLDFLKLTK